VRRDNLKRSVLEGAIDNDSLYARGCDPGSYNMTLTLPSNSAIFIQVPHVPLELSCGHLQNQTLLNCTTNVKPACLDWLRISSMVWFVLESRCHTSNKTLAPG
jgi:hypothetical protein